MKLETCVSVKKNGRTEFDSINLDLSLPAEWTLKDTKRQGNSVRQVYRSEFSFTSGPGRVVQLSLESHPFGELIIQSPERMFNNQKKALAQQFFLRKFIGEYTSGGGGCIKDLHAYPNYKYVAFVNMNKRTFAQKLGAWLSRTPPTELMVAESFVLYCFQVTVLSFSSVLNREANEADNALTTEEIKAAIKTWVNS